MTTCMMTNLLHVYHGSGGRGEKMTAWNEYVVQLRGGWQLLPKGGGGARS